MTPPFPTGLLNTSMIKRSWFGRCFDGITKFRLTKHYFDCIDDRGNCFIVYWAKIETFLASVTYSGIIFSDEKGQTKQLHSFRRVVSPIINDDIHLNNEHLNIRGSWKNISEPVSATLFTDSSKNNLIWVCHHPKALAEIFFENSIYNGFGYGETLSMSVKPWNLPINELRWGRFLSDKYSVIWIHWTGSHDVNSIYCNGAEFNDLVFEPERISFNKGNFILIFEKIQVIRDGRISDSVTFVPLLRIISKKRILASIETKYKAKSTLVIDSETSESGWSLYETVIWEK
jgi:hypothetical protein